MEGEGGDVPHDETFEQFTARYGSVGACQTGRVRGMEMWKDGPEAAA